MLPKAIREFDEIDGGPAATDKLLLDASASRFGSATVGDVVAAGLDDALGDALGDVANADKQWPWVAYFSTSGLVGPIVTTVYTLPANTLKENGQSIRVEVLARKTDGPQGSDNAAILVGGTTICNSFDNGSGTVAFVGHIVRTGPTSAMVWQEGQGANHNVTMNWAAALDFQYASVDAATTAHLVRVVVEP